jgi:predicted ATP-dependent protease
VLYESSTWAELDGSDIVTKDHVEKAISEKIYRSNRIEERLLSMIEREKYW